MSLSSLSSKFPTKTKISRKTLTSGAGRRLLPWLPSRPRFSVPT